MTLFSTNTQNVAEFLAKPLTLFAEDF